MKSSAEIIACNYVKCPTVNGW